MSYGSNNIQKIQKSKKKFDDEFTKRYNNKSHKVRTKRRADKRDTLWNLILKDN